MIVCTKPDPVCLTTPSVVRETDTWYAIWCGWLCWISSTCPPRATPTSGSTSFCALAPLLSSSSATVQGEMLQGEGVKEKSQGTYPPNSRITKFLSWSPQRPIHTLLCSDSRNCYLLFPCSPTAGVLNSLAFPKPCPHSCYYPYWSVPSASYQNPHRCIDLRYNWGCGGFNCSGKWFMSSLNY